jgi:thiosulfate/3-mercaptopyruvate sulfurtransferase
MAPERLPLLIEPDQLEPLLDQAGLLVVDVCKDATYAQLHIPGAIHLAYAQMVGSSGMTHGLLPDPTQLEQLFSNLGIDADTHVVAYDDEGGGNACRLLWTLEAMGHRRFSLLNGGLHAWANEKHPLSREPAHPEPRVFRAEPEPSIVADAAFIQQRLEDADLALWDARSRNEYTGVSRFSQYPGHIPGAAHLDWLELMDRSRNLRLKPEGELRNRLAEMGIGEDQEVVAYCQTHHRSSLAYFVLKLLGFKRIRGYPGSWSDWGSRSDTPKVQGKG